MSWDPRAVAVNINININIIRLWMTRMTVQLSLCSDSNWNSINSRRVVFHDMPFIHLMNSSGLMENKRTRFFLILRSDGYENVEDFWDSKQSRVPLRTRNWLFSKLGTRRLRFIDVFSRAKKWQREEKWPKKFSAKCFVHDVVKSSSLSEKKKKWT